MCPSETTRPLSVCQSELVVPVTEDPPPPPPHCPEHAGSGLTAGGPDGSPSLVYGSRM